MSSTIKAVYYTINRNTKKLYRTEYDEFSLEKVFDYVPYCIGGTSEDDIYIVGGPPPVIYKRNPNGSWSEIVSPFKTSYPSKYFSSLYMIGPENFALTLYDEKELIFYNSGSFINYILPEKVYSYDGEYAICSHPTKARYFNGSSWEPVSDVKLYTPSGGSFFYQYDGYISPGNHLLAKSYEGNTNIFDGLLNSSTIIRTQSNSSTPTTNPNIWGDSSGRILVVCSDFFFGNGLILERKDSIWTSKTIGNNGSLEPLYTLSVANVGDPEEDCIVFSGKNLIVFKRTFGYVKQRLDVIKGETGGHYSCALVQSTYKPTKRIFVGISGEDTQGSLINYDGEYWLYPGLITRYKLTLNEDGHAGVDCIWGSDQNNIWIGSNNSLERAIYKFNGSSFSKVLTTTPEKLYAAYGTSSTDLWFAGDRFYHYNGSWSNQDILGADTIYGLVVFNDGSGWATGSGGKGYILSGGVWSEYGLIDSSLGKMNAIWGMNYNNVWVGGENGLWFWNGLVWTKITIDRPYGDRAIYSIHGTSSSDVWFGLEDGKLEHWDGSTYTEYTVNGVLEGTIKSINMVHKGLGYAVGSNNSTWGGGLISEWNGYQWQAPLDSGDKNRSTDLSSVWGFSLGGNSPNLQNINPFIGSINNSINTNIILEIVDNDGDLYEPSIEITIGGLIAWQNSSQQTGFSIVRSPITDGYRYNINPDANFNYYQTVVIDAYAYDILDNILDTSYSFKTIDPTDPNIRNQNPSPNETDVSVSSNITLEIYDEYSGLNESSVIIKVDGDIAWQSLSQQPGFTISTIELTDGYRYIINPDNLFDSYQNVTIEVYALDISGNILDTNYLFKIEDITLPGIRNQNPSPNEIGVSISSNIVLEIYDDYSGLNESSVIITVNGDIAWQNSLQQTGFTVTRTSVSNGYKYDINPDNNFDYFQTVTINVYAYDYSNNILDTSYIFKTIDPISPNIRNQNPLPNEIDVNADSNITLEIYDDLSGLNTSSVIIKVDGDTAWQSLSQQSGFIVSTVELVDGYRYIINPDDLFDSYQNVIIEVYASDISGNILDTNYLFKITDNVSPNIRNQTPSPNEIDVSIDSNIILEIYDDHSGLDESSVIITINENIAWQNSSQQTGFIVTRTSVSNGYKYDINPDSNFRSGEEITTEIYAKDLKNNILDTLYLFTSEFINSIPVISNTFPTSGQTNVSRTTIVKFTISDDINDIVLNTLNVTIDNIQVISSGLFINGYSGQIYPSGNQYTVGVFPKSPSFLPRASIINVHLEVNNVYGTQVVEDYSFFTDGYQSQPENGNGDYDYLQRACSYIRPFFPPYEIGLKLVSDSGTGTEVELSWREAGPHNSNNIVLYNIYYSTKRSEVFSNDPEFIVENTETSIGGLPPGNIHYFGVRAVEIDPNTFTFNGLIQTGVDMYFYPKSILTSDILYNDIFIPAQTDGFPEYGIIIINSELIKYSSLQISPSGFVVNTRGFNHSVASDHLTGEEIKLYNGVEDSNTVIVQSTPTFQKPNYALTWVKSDGYGPDGYRDGYDGYDTYYNNGLNASNLFDGNDGYYRYNQKPYDSITTDGTGNDNSGDFSRLDYCGTWRGLSPANFMKGQCRSSYFGGAQIRIDSEGNRHLVKVPDVQTHMLQREELLLETTGEPFVLLRRMWTGVRCLCIMNRREHPDARCPVCFSTGFVQGFIQFFNLRRQDRRILIRLDPATDDLNIVDRGGFEPMYEPNGWTLPFPAIKDRDILIKFNSNNTEEFRYEILDVSRVRALFGQSGTQKLKIKRLPKTSMIYQFPVVRDMKPMSETIDTSVSFGPGIVSHSHQVIIPEGIDISKINVATLESEGHNHIIFSGNVQTVLGHKHNLIL